MGAFRLVVLICGIILSFSGGSRGECESPQYLPFGKIGNISCSFHDGFYIVAWYTPESFEKQTPLIRLVNGAKKGEGLNRGEYDIDEEGSLIINNVTLEHITNFTALIFESKGDNPKSVTVEADVVVKPLMSFPVTDICLNETVCHTSLDQHSGVTCFVANSRPAINVSWIARSSTGDVHISSERSVTSAKDGLLFTSQATTTDIFLHSSFLSYLVCVADAIPEMMTLTENESSILIENSGIDLLAREPIVTYVKKQSTLELTCTKVNITLIVWKKAIRNGNFRIISYGAFFEKLNSKTYDNEYALQNDGSLVVPQIKIIHEGLYGCIYEHNITLFDVVVYVPARPIIQGCAIHQDCVLEAQKEGAISCSVKGIRPKVTLEWKTFSKQESSKISFTDHQLTTDSSGDVYDITLNSTYRLEDISMARITIECTTSQVLSDVLKSSEKVDLLFSSAVQPTGESASSSKKNLWWILGIIVILCLLVILVYRMRILKGRRRNSRMRESFHQGEVTPMISAEMPSQAAPHSDLKTVFKRELKTKYKDQYDAVNPIPYIKDRLYCVARVFVEGGFEKLISRDSKEGLENWEKLTSYHEVTDMSSSSTRTIIEGDPGYGKSTLTLQLAYDWCNCNAKSPLANVDILILLRLRQLGGLNSLFTAIKQFLLPKDSPLSEDNIKTILQQNISTMIILDGFDEYPEEETDNLTDIISIIKGEMLQESFVIFTTRSFVLPKSYPPQSHRIRLTGFDSKARDAYIRKAVVGDNKKAAAKIKRSLQENSVLQGLCQVPMFFVILAHMTHESKKFTDLISVTNFFQYIIACFHSDKKNQVSDMNVKKVTIHENDHTALDEIAFLGLSGKHQKIVWGKENLIQRLGKEVYDQYRRSGILVEEEVPDIRDRPGDIRYDTEVRFYHKLFCEWYAAHYLCRKVIEPDANLPKILENMNPFDLQYTYRFACGLDPQAGIKIIEYLRDIKDGDKFAVLCLVEQSDKDDRINETVQELCSNCISIDNKDSLLLQGSIVQLLKIASTNQISIPHLYLSNCYSTVNLSGGSYLQLKSNLSIPVLTTLSKLTINTVNEGREITAEEFAGILHYSSKCLALKELELLYCLLPQSAQPECISVLRPRNIKVFWHPHGFDFEFFSEYKYQLNRGSGLWQRVKYLPLDDSWKVLDVTMTDKDYQSEVSAFRKVRRRLGLT